MSKATIVKIIVLAVALVFLAFITFSIKAGLSDEYWGVEGDFKMDVYKVENYTAKVAPEGLKYVLLKVTFNMIVDLDDDILDDTRLISPQEFVLKTAEGKAYHYSKDIPHTVPSKITLKIPSQFSIGFAIPVDEDPHVLTYQYGIYGVSTTC